MADNRANLLYGESASLSALLSNIVNSRNIINVGIITKVIDENFINVRLYNTDIESSPTYISAVRLLHIGTSKLKIKVTPAIGDTVLLLANRDFIEVLENNHDKKAAEVSKKKLEEYSNLSLTITDRCTQGEIVHAGGVDLKYIDKNCKSKVCDNLWFCGEILNIDGFCGGFNLQNCWSSAGVVAKDVIRSIIE